MFKINIIRIARYLCGSRASCLYICRAGLPQKAGLRKLSIMSSDGRSNAQAHWVESYWQV